MKAEIKLNPTRLIVPKYNNSPMLLLEKLSETRLPLISLIDKGEYFEVILPLTKHSIRPYKEYINNNLGIEE